MFSHHLPTSRGTSGDWVVYQAASPKLGLQYNGLFCQLSSQACAYSHQGLLRHALLADPPIKYTRDSSVTYSALQTLSRIFCLVFHEDCETAEYRTYLTRTCRGLKELGRKDHENNNQSEDDIKKHRWWLLIKTTVKLRATTTRLTQFHSSTEIIVRGMFTDFVAKCCSR